MNLFTIHFELVLVDLDGGSVTRFHLQGFQKTAQFFRRGHVRTQKFVLHGEQTPRALLGQEGQAGGHRILQTVENHHQGILHAAFQAVGFTEAPLQFSHPVIQGLGLGRFFGFAFLKPFHTGGGGFVPTHKIGFFLRPLILPPLGALTCINGLSGILAGLFIRGLGGRKSRTGAQNDG